MTNPLITKTSVLSLQHASAMTLNRFMTLWVRDSQEKVQYLLPPHHLHPLSNQKKINKLMSLFQIQNSVNPVAWVNEAALRMRIVIGGLAPVQVVFIYPHTTIRGLWAAVKSQHMVNTSLLISHPSTLKQFLMCISVQSTWALRLVKHW